MLDTNILVAGLRNRTGASFQIIDWIVQGKITPVVTVPMVLEYEEVLKRPGIVPNLSARDVDTFLDYFVSKSEGHRVHYLWRPFLPDPDDDMLVEAALTSRANLIVTGNLGDLRPAATLGIQVMTAGEFARMLRSR